ncbi:MAG TPA: hypothetical protein VFP00_07740 [Burkholderiales bacterium]|nr:hypothetical protein [Burkholderiales bacterium]
MSNGIVSSHRWLFVPVAVAVAIGCSKEPERPRDAATERPVKASSQQLKTYSEDQRNALRTTMDTARGRVWMLSLDNTVRIYDQRSKKLLREIALPDWLAVRTACMPNVIVDRSGAAFISSNVTPWIWRIDGETFDLKVHEISLRGREGLDVGFATLAFDSSGMLYGLAPSANWLWAIDMTRANASMVQVYDPPLEECTLTAQHLERRKASR